MSVRINQISENRYEVNDKLLFQNMYNEWVCPSNDMSVEEMRAFREHLKSSSRDLNESNSEKLNQ